MIIMISLLLFSSFAVAGVTCKNDGTQRTVCTITANTGDADGFEMMLTILLKTLEAKQPTLSQKEFLKSYEEFFERELSKSQEERK
jgi:hypothetical protein